MIHWIDRNEKTRIQSRHVTRNCPTGNTNFVLLARIPRQSRE